MFRRYSSSSSPKFWEQKFKGFIVRQIPIISDNYVYIIRDEVTGVVGAVDPGEAAPVMDVLNSWGWNLDYILSTHHHWDHVGGNLELKEKTGCKIVGGFEGQDRIPGIDKALKESEIFELGAQKFIILNTPGHTIDHITFANLDTQCIFSGDTVFAMGCGRLFEGTPQQMFTSFNKIIKSCTNETIIYGTHEYTQANAKFALSLEKENDLLNTRNKIVNEKRKDSQPTVPFTLQAELETSPFFRWKSAEIKSSLGLPEAAEDIDVFTAVRKAKDTF